MFVWCLLCSELKTDPPASSYSRFRTVPTAVASSGCSTWTSRYKTCTCIMIYDFTSPVTTIKRLQNKTLCLHMCVYIKMHTHTCIYLKNCMCMYLDLYTVSHRSECTPHIFVNILLYLFMRQHWRNYTLLQCKVVSVQLV